MAYTLNNFTQGELSKRLIARKGLEQYKNGAQKIQNFQILAQGGISRRPGTKFVTDLGDVSKALRLVPFVYSQSESYVLAFYGDRIKIFTQGGGEVENSEVSLPEEWKATGHSYNNYTMYLTGRNAEDETLNSYEYWKATNDKDIDSAYQYERATN